MNILCNNKKASFRYNLIKKMEAGMVLEGWEVKSIKSGHGQISESYISIRDDEIFLINSHFKILQNSTDSDKLSSTRKRKLLLKKREIDLLKIEVKQNGSSPRCKNGSSRSEAPANRLLRGGPQHDRERDYFFEQLKAFGGAYCTSSSSLEHCASLYALQHTPQSTFRAHTLQKLTLKSHKRIFLLQRGSKLSESQCSSAELHWPYLRTHLRI